MLSGDNGVLKRAAESTEETRGGAVQEQRDLWKLEQTSDQYAKTQSTKSLATLLEELGPYGQKLLTADEISTINETGQVTIGSKTIVFKEILTVGSEYDKGHIKIGDKLSYSANGSSDWIVFGKDNAGNVLLTSKSPVGSYSITYDAQHWLTWEDDLDAECSGYGTTLQGKTISARSIRIEDINRVVGFTEPEFTKYKFTTDTDADYENGKLNYYYPSLNAANNSPAYLQRATVTDLEAAIPDVPAKEFELNGYLYGYDTTSKQYKFTLYASSTIEENIDLTNNLKLFSNMKYAVGEAEKYFQYYVASRSLRHPSTFSVALVFNRNGTSLSELIYFQLLLMDLLQVVGLKDGVSVR